MFSTFTSALFFAAVAFTTHVSAFGVIVPLYIYPGTSCSGWTAVSNAVSTYHDLTFYIIINPNSGPGTGAQPDSNYESCIPTLRPAANPNVFVLGYVATGAGARATSLVNADIAKYAGWGSAYKPTGIFFDEGATAATYVSKYQQYSATAWNSFDVVILNPGSTPDAGYYKAADYIVTREDYYSSFSVSQLVIGSKTPASQQAVILHDGPATPNAALINQLGNLGIEAIYITDITEANNPYGSLPTQWSTFVKDTNAENNAL